MKVEFHIKHWKVTTNGIKIYYVRHNGHFYIEVKVLDNKPKRSEVAHKNEKLVQQAQRETIDFYYNKL